MAAVEYLDNMDSGTFNEFVAGMTAGKSKSERVIYWRLPETWPSGQPNPRANWIIWGDSQTFKMIDQMENGWVPLRKYGPIRHERGEQDESPYARILRHPDGAAEFPLSQVLTYQWFDPKRVPVSGVRFPCLRGEKITVYPCPECTTAQYLDAIYLARHLRNTHDYSTKDIFDYGDRINIDFGRRLGSKGVRELAFPDEADEPPVVDVPPEPDFEIEPVTADGRRGPTPAQVAARAAASERMRRRNEAQRAAKAAA